MTFLLATTSALPALTLIFLALAVGLALCFEFLNGFHDTANAVATVIYTNTLKATPAVIWSGIWNFIGVMVSNGAVAFGIVALLPVDLVINIGSTAGFAMVFALLLSAILWNFGTWYLGLPASSSHTLIGSIMGVGLANSLMHGGMTAFGAGLNWPKVQEVGLALLISPVVGFVLAALLLVATKALIKNPSLYKAPEGDAPPPVWIRILLLLTCTGVSYAHGSNDGQKGMGLIVLILVGILPGVYALKMDATPAMVHEMATASAQLHAAFASQASDATLSQKEAEKALSSYLKGAAVLSPTTYSALSSLTGSIATGLKTDQSFDELTEGQRRTMRTNFYLVSSSLKKLSATGASGNPATSQVGRSFVTAADALTNYIPSWVKIAVAIALGLGTMIGYKRIVVTIGEKIGKSHLTYAQGASAGLVSVGTILAASRFGLPVSTTHILSSGIAGTMVANGSGLQRNTVRNILLAWVLTLPACIFLGALFFAFGLNLLFMLGLK